MATPEAKALEHFLDRLSTLIQHVLLTVGNEAVADYLISPQELQKCLLDTMTSHQKAATFLDIIGTKIDADPSVLRAFIEVLKRESFLDELVADMGEYNII